MPEYSPSQLDTITDNAHAAVLDEAHDALIDTLAHTYACVTLRRHVAITRLNRHAAAESGTHSITNHSSTTARLQQDITLAAARALGVGAAIRQLDGYAGQQTSDLAAQVRDASEPLYLRARDLVDADIDAHGNTTTTIEQYLEDAQHAMLTDRAREHSAEYTAANDWSQARD